MSCNEYKLVILGRGAVGKTSIVTRFICGYFPETYDPTIGGDDYRRQISVDGQICMLDILDYCGEMDEFSAIREQYMRAAQGYVIVYSIADLDSFESISYYYDQIIHTKGTRNVPIILIGNKCDLEEEKRQVAREQGEELARQLNCPFFETSAKENICIDDTFPEVVREINARLPPEPEPEPVEESKKRSKFLKFFKRK